MNPIWAQLIAAASGIITTLGVKYLDHALAERAKRAAEARAAKEQPS